MNTKDKFIQFSFDHILSYRKIIMNYLIYLYLFLIFIVFIFFDSSMYVKMLLYLCVNCIISLCSFKFINYRNKYWIFFIILSLVFFFVYIFKSIILYTLGFDTLYLLSTIKTVLSMDDYIVGLKVVTVSHLTMSCFCIFVSNLFLVLPYKKLIKNYVTDITLNRLLNLVFLWIIFSSFLMYYAGVGLMGSEGKSLPFKLSGVLFYSRTIILPLFFLYVIEKAIVLGRKFLFKKVMLLYLLLALSEIIVRASKAPLLHLTLLISLLFIILIVNGEKIKLKLNRRNILLLIFSSVVFFPIIEIYRDMAVFGFSTNFLIDSINQAYNQSIFLLASEKFFHRLIGFTQLAGIISLDLHNQSLEFIASFGNIAKYYTKHILDIYTLGHLSSPSLLGTTVLLAGSKFYPVVLIFYFIYMFFIFVLTYKFKYFKYPVMSILGYELFNTIMSGTIVLSLFRIFLLFTFAFCFELFFKFLNTETRTSQ